jgi:hypothetical protein
MGGKWIAMIKEPEPLPSPAPKPIVDLMLYPANRTLA